MRQSKPILVTIAKVQAKRRHFGPGPTTWACLEKRQKTDKEIGQKKVRKKHKRGGKQKMMEKEIINKLIKDEREGKERSIMMANW